MLAIVQGPKLSVTPQFVAVCLPLFEYSSAPTHPYAGCIRI
jgi:hypothetical protein